MASHARPKPSSARRALLRGGMIATVAGTALGASSMAAASAAEPATSAPPVSAADPATSAANLTTELVEGLAYGAGGLETSAGRTLPAVTDLQLNPLANTGSDPLDNGVGTQVADMPPVGTRLVTGPLADGAALSELPLVGPATGLLPG